MAKNIRTIKARRKNAHIQGLNSFAKDILEKPENMTELERKVSIECGNPMRIKLINSKEVEVVHKEENPIQELAQNMDLPLNIIE